MAEQQMSWGEYCEAHAVTEHEEGPAFSAYLSYLSGGEWDGDFRRVDGDAAEP